MRGCGTHGSSGGSPRLVWLGLNSPVSSSGALGNVGAQVLEVAEVSEEDHDAVVALDGEAEGVGGVLTGLEDAPVLAGSRQAPLEPLGEGGMAGEGEVPIGLIAAALGGQGVPRPGPLGGIAQADG